MKIEQIYTGCLAQGAYYIVSDGEAAIVDPLRESGPYLNRLKRDGVKLKYIFETHFHADFVSGHVDLARETGASIVYGPAADPQFDCIRATDGQQFSIGKLCVVVLHTPGHTLESTTYLLRDENGKDYCIFSGDTLFLGDVGRPDLAQKSAHMTQEELAGMLYDSLMTKIMPLADDVIVYPAHGAGSACGKNMSKETEDTLGNQKKTNYALNQPDKAAFIKAVTDGLLPPPAYFGYNVAMNKAGYQPFESVLHNGMQALEPDTFEYMSSDPNILVLDTRSPGVFCKGHVPGSVNIGLEGDFAPWVGALLTDVRQPILLVTDPGREEESVTRLSRVGFDQVLGHLKGGIASWISAGKMIGTVNRISAGEFAGQLGSDSSLVIDVRRESEYAKGHVSDARSLPLSDINNWMSQIDPDQHFFLHCAGGYRSMIAASILQSRGIRNFSEVEGGYNAIMQAGVPTTDLIA
jgi:glyoxylase-like metal-dependent hydrolase (beta-lactamase superfamily II)/rhodanese-related sulfurtransferase